jgi:acetyl-CoA hydrolase
VIINRKDKKHGEKGKLDWAIIEATAVTEDGGIVPGARLSPVMKCSTSLTVISPVGASVGATPEIVQSAEKVIMSVNLISPKL